MDLQHQLNCQNHEACYIKIGETAEKLIWTLSAESSMEHPSQQRRHDDEFTLLEFVGLAMCPISQFSHWIASKAEKLTEDTVLAKAPSRLGHCLTGIWHMP